MIVYLILTVLLIAADQLIKYWAVTVLRPLGSLPLLQGVFHLTYVENTGAAFSMLEGRRGFFIVITLAAFLVFGWLYKSGMFRGHLGHACIACIAGGAVGNFIDRLRLGYVIDMFDFRLIHFPVFNFADICITVGACLFILVAWRDYRAEQAREQPRKGENGR